MGVMAVDFEGWCRVVLEAEIGGGVGGIFGGEGRR